MAVNINNYLTDDEETWDKNYMVVLQKKKHKNTVNGICEQLGCLETKRVSET